jgi:hypothetical protein
MDNSYTNPESGNRPHVEARTVLLRLALFVAVLFTTYWLLLWLHPMGAHRFFWNLVLGALAFHVILRLALPPLKVNSPKVEHQQ